MPKEYMINALVSLQKNQIIYTKKHDPHLAFKINAPSKFFSIFASHPPIEKRIQRLQQL